VALSLATGHTKREAALVGNVSESTVKRWTKKPAFQKRVSQLQSEIVTQALGKLTAATTAAADTLARLLSSKDERVSLEAARSVLTQYAKVREVAELNEEFEQMEHKFRAWEKRRLECS
jgi:hypothetical protein